MKIALLHEHYNPEHLEKVIKKMKRLGAPKIKAVWMNVYDHWVALEGCHRLRAAEILGLTPNIIEVEYSEDMVDIQGSGEKFRISDICDGSHKAEIKDFKERRIERL